MSHISSELFAILVWGNLLLVTGVFLYLLSALRDAGGIRFDLVEDIETARSGDERRDDRDEEPVEGDQRTNRR